jgi:formylglycine-generating enzyme required for sulfatase activity
MQTLEAASGARDPYGPRLFCTEERVGTGAMTTDAAAPAGPQSKARVFISYSRKDSAAFADELVIGLEDRGFAPFLDRHDIKPGEPWEARLGGLIEQSDTVVFVISPESVKSDRCVWEVDKALGLSKRLLPVIYKAVPDVEIPANLSDLQFVRFDTMPGMMRPLRELAEALRVDLDWIREHTRLAELAARWQSRNRAQSLLLRDDEVDAAKAWVVKRKSDAPQITELQRNFLSASEQAETARNAESKAARGRTRRTQILVGALAAVIILGFAAYWNDQALKGLYFWFTHVRALTAQAERVLKPGETFWECIKTDANYSKYCPEMVLVPSGKFIMGSPATENDRYDDEGPQHEIAIARRFAVSKLEVTFDQLDACVQYGGCTRVGDPFGGGKQPAINVKWDEAQEYVKWLSGLTGQQYRLLSEAEWEYAARARTTGPYSFEGDDSVLGEYAWYAKNSGNRTHPVGEKKPNGFGLYDMHGNVWEWVEDCYHDSYQEAPSDGSAWIVGACGERVVRGGAWGGNPRDLRSAVRGGNTPGNRTNVLGFRVGRTLTP